MTSDNAGGALLDAPKIPGEGGGFWSPDKPKTYVGRFTGLTLGPQDWTVDREVTDKETGEKKTVKVPNPQVRWNFDVLTLAGRKPVMFTDDNDNERPATTDILSSKTFSAKSKAGKIVQALVGPQDWAALTAEGPAATVRLVNEAVGKYAVLSFSQVGDRIRATEVSPIDDDEDE
jgi:hypothetical protein